MCSATTPAAFTATTAAFVAVQIVELEAAEDGLEGIQQEVQMLQAFNCPQLTRYYGSIVVGRYVCIDFGQTDVRFRVYILFVSCYDWRGVFNSPEKWARMCVKRRYTIAVHLYRGITSK